MLVAPVVAGPRMGPIPLASHVAFTPKKAAADTRFAPSSDLVLPLTQPFTDGAFTPQAAASAFCDFFGGPAKASAIRSAKVLCMLGKPTQIKIGISIDDFVRHA